jgi:hypothetical protein
MLKNQIPKLLIATIAILSACTPVTPTNNNGTPNPSQSGSPGTVTSTNLPDSLKSGLVLYLPFEGNANDLSENKNNGAVEGLVTFVPGKIGQAASFNGNVEEAGTYVVVKEKDSERYRFTNKFSISAWAFDREVPEVVYRPILTKGRDNEDYTLWFTSAGADLLLNWGTDNEFWPHLENTANASIAQNKWVHFVVTYDGSKIKYFNNGVMTSSYDYNKAIDTHPEDLFIGASFPGSLEMFNGMMDEIRLYDRAISDSEVTALFNQK